MMDQEASAFSENMGADLKSIFSTTTTERYQTPNTEIPENATESKDCIQALLISQNQIKEELFGTAEIKVEQDYDDEYYDPTVEVKQEKFQEGYDNGDNIEVIDPDIDVYEESEYDIEEKVHRELHRNKIHRNPKLKDKYPCKSCAQAFAKESELELHTMVFRFTCQVCSQHFLTPRKLKRHALSHANKNYRCYQCDKSFVDPRYLKNHMKQHEGPRFFCNKCPKDFCSEQSLKQHKKSHEGIRYMCNQCPVTFNRVNSLKRHMKMHDGNQYFCSKCPKVFTLECTLKKHMKNHSGIRFHCSQCTRSYIEKGGLMQHMKIHRGERYKCNLCPEEFLYSNQLTRHRIVKHLHDETEIIALD